SDALAQICAAEDSDRLAHAIASLPERLQQVMQLYFIDELSLAEIAAALNVSVPRLDKLKASAIEKLRDALP
ncbi:MAG: sigma-70 family RNA polymerase sigma factor, partial [Pontixanthobacter sp.]